MLLRYEIDAVVDAARTADDDVFNAVLGTLQKAFADLGLSRPPSTRTATSGNASFDAAPTDKPTY